MNLIKWKILKPGLVLFLILVVLLIASCGVTTNPPESISEPIIELEDVSNNAEGVPQLEPGAFQGIPVGYTEDGYPYMGDPNAPVILEEYSDFLCPFCARHYDETVPSLIDQYVKTGQVLYVFHDLPLIGLHPTAPLGHISARCAAQQDAAVFWAMHEKLFTQQNAWSQVQDPTSFLTGLAESIGVDKADYEKCIADGTIADKVQNSVREGNALGFTGTPSFQLLSTETGDTSTIIGAYPLTEFTARLDALIAGEPVPQAEEPPPPEPVELPYWANVEGLAPNPDRPGFNMAGDPYKGNPEAPLIVVEFTDFACPACQTHALEVQPAVDKEFIDNGKILWVFKNLPLQVHPNAPAAAVAAECAGEQGLFWEMHHLLFERVEEWSVSETDGAILSLEKELDLDSTAFTNCFNSRQALENVLDDLYDAQGIINTTPNFVILHDGAGTLMQNSLPVDQFISALDSYLE